MKKSEAITLIATASVLSLGLLRYEQLHRPVEMPVIDPSGTVLAASDPDGEIAFCVNILPFRRLDKKQHQAAIYTQHIHDMTFLAVLQNKDAEALEPLEQAHAERLSLYKKHASEIKTIKADTDSAKWLLPGLENRSWKIGMLLGALGVAYDQEKALDMALRFTHDGGTVAIRGANPATFDITFPETGPFAEPANQQALRQKLEEAHRCCETRRPMLQNARFIQQVKDLYGQSENLGPIKVSIPEQLMRSMRQTAFGPEAQEPGYFTSPFGKITVNDGSKTVEFEVSRNNLTSLMQLDRQYPGMLAISTERQEISQSR